MAKTAVRDILKRRRSDVAMPLIAAVAVVLVVYCSAVPLGYLFGWAGNGEALSGAFHEPFLWSTFRDTLIFGVVACVVSLVVGGAIAFLVTRTDMPLKR